MKRIPFEHLDEHLFDVVVIGGGVIGAGIARDAALRGLHVALFEKDDFAAGTSSRSTRLIHGGLRYLELFDFGLVRQDLKEREILLHVAPHLVKPLAFVVPVWSRSLFYRTKLRIGMILYDLLSFDKSLPNHTVLDAAATLKREPKLREEGLQGAFVYYDAQVPSTERLVMENILDATDHGAQIWNHTRVTGLISEGQNVAGVKAENTMTGQTVEVRSKLVINAAGPWLDALTTELMHEPSNRVRMTKGIHFTSPPASNQALVLFAQTDNRLFFVIPWLGYAWVGTTDTDYTASPDVVRADGSDVDYLRESVEAFLPKADWQTVYFTTAGLRALVRKEGVDESAVSRKHALVDFAKTDGRSGIMSVVGGKLTAYRGIAQEAVDMATEKIGLTAKTRTIKEPLPGGRFGTQGKNAQAAVDTFREQFRRDAKAQGLTEAQSDNLVSLYGSLAKNVLALVKQNPELGQPLHPDYPDILAQIHRAVNDEYCLTVSDFLLRRSMLGFTKDQGLAALERVADEMTNLLHWPPATRAENVATYRAHVAISQKWRDEINEPAPMPTSAMPQMESKVRYR